MTTSDFDELGPLDVDPEAIPCACGHWMDEHLPNSDTGCLVTGCPCEVFTPEEP